MNNQECFMVSLDGMLRQFFLGLSGFVDQDKGI
jgi:hypothetical protein